MDPRRDPEREPLALLRARLEAAHTETALARLAEALGRDGREGARALGRRAAERLRRQRRERRRLARLFSLRRRLVSDGACVVAGVDEVGVGPLAGPVVACAVVLPERPRLPRLDDSKRLAPELREELAARIREQAAAISLREVAVEEIDRVNIYWASVAAKRRALEGLAPAPDHVLVDGRPIPELRFLQTALVGGDRRDGSIAAASIVAKVHRDALMCRLAERYPGYGFDRHKGYGTAEHLAALRRLGPSPIHRRSFAPVAERC